jgi:hypothetical protein
MHFEYTAGVRDSIGRCLGGVEELEAQIERLCRGQEVSRVTIAPLAPGRSGAVVALVRRLEGPRTLKPWVVKIAETYALLRQERRNFEALVKDRWQLVPQLLDTGASRILIYECGGFLEGYAPTALWRGYAQTPPDALSILMQRIVAALTPLHAFAGDTLPFVEREGFEPSLADQLASLSSIPSDLAEALLVAWQQTLQRASELPRLVSTGCHGDLNAGNILFQPGPNASYPLFIDFGQMHGNPSRGYPANGHPPFWDFAKLERDIKTRLFLAEASSEGLSLEVIVAALQHLDRFQPGASLPADLAAVPAVQHGFSPPATFQAWYRISVASATLRVLYRSPDADIDPAIQQRAAAESALALLSPASTTPQTAASASSHPPETLSTSSSDALPSKPSTLLVRSFASQPASPPHDPALMLDLTDLFHDRDPLHDQVWAEAIPRLPPLDRLVSRHPAQPQARCGDFAAARRSHGFGALGQHRPPAAGGSDRLAPEPAEAELWRRSGVGAVCHSASPRRCGARVRGVTAPDRPSASSGTARTGKRRRHRWPPRPLAGE